MLTIKLIKGQIDSYVLIHCSQLLLMLSVEIGVAWCLKDGRNSVWKRTHMEIFSIQAKIEEISSDAHQSHAIPLHHFTIYSHGSYAEAKF